MRGDYSRNLIDSSMVIQVIPLGTNQWYVEWFGNAYWGYKHLFDAYEVYNDDGRLPAHSNSLSYAFGNGDAYGDGWQ